MELQQMESIITTQLKVRVPRLLNNEYPNISFTNEISDKTPSFPNVYIHELEANEVGNSLMNQTIHAIRNTYQIEITTNTTKADAKKVANACVKAMKALSFSVTNMPIYTKVNNVNRYIIRAQRIVASGDTF